MCVCMRRVGSRMRSLPALVCKGALRHTGNCIILLPLLPSLGSLGGVGGDVGVSSTLPESVWRLYTCTSFLPRCVLYALYGLSGCYLYLVQGRCVWVNTVSYFNHVLGCVSPALYPPLTRRRRAYELDSETPTTKTAFTPTQQYPRPQ